MTQLELALAYIAKGWRVFPVHSMVRMSQCSCGRKDCKNKGKHPRTTNGVKDATIDQDIVTRWWTDWPDANIAIATGRVSGMIVIDIDQRKAGFDNFERFEEDRGQPLPETLISLTGGGGRHIIFGYPQDGQPVSNRGNWLPGVDVKSDGGYIVAPASSHESGGYYQWLTSMDQPLAQPPLDLLFGIRNGSSGSGKDPLPSAKNILDGIEEGSRDETLFRWACRLRRQHSTDDDGGRAVVEKLVLEAAANCTPAFPRDEALRKVEQAFLQDHSDDVFEWTFTTEDDEPIRRLTDLGNALRFVDRFHDDLRFVPQWGWLAWTAIGWQRVSDEYVDGLAREVPDMLRVEAEGFRDDPRTRANFLKWARDSESAGRLSAIGRLAKSDGRVMSAVGSFDSEDHLLACRNGILDLRTGQLRPFSRSDHVTKNTNVVYDPNIDSRVWDDFLKETMQGDIETIDYLQRLFGYSLTGSISAELMILLSGPPASGKSTFLDGLHAAMGSYATTTQSDTFMYKRGQQTPKDELARLAGQRLVSVSEIRQGESFNEALIKQLTGGDMVTARFLYHDAFEFRPQMKIWLATNYDPDTRDTAMWRRIKKIGFNHSVPYDKRNPKLKQMIRDPEIGGRIVLAWGVRGAIDFYANDGKIAQPLSVTAATANYRSDQDRFAAFLDETVDRVPGGVCTVNELYATYQLWSKNNGEFPIKRTQFAQEIVARGMPPVRAEDARTLVVPGIVIRAMHVTQNGMSWG